MIHSAAQRSPFTVSIDLNTTEDCKSSPIVIYPLCTDTVIILSGCMETASRTALNRNYMHRVARIYRHTSEAMLSPRPVVRCVIRHVRTRGLFCGSGLFACGGSGSVRVDV
jgi:hypothetical protein